MINWLALRIRLVHQIKKVYRWCLIICNRWRGLRGLLLDDGLWFIVWGACWEIKIELSKTLKIVIMILLFVYFFRAFAKLWKWVITSYLRYNYFLFFILMFISYRFPHPWLKWSIINKTLKMHLILRNPNTMIINIVPKLKVNIKQSWITFEFTSFIYISTLNLIWLFSFHLRKNK